MFMLFNNYALLILKYLPVIFIPVRDYSLFQLCCLVVIFIPVYIYVLLQLCCRIVIFILCFVTILSNKLCTIAGKLQFAHLSSVGSFNLIWNSTKMYKFKVKSTFS